MNCVTAVYLRYRLFVVCFKPRIRWCSSLDKGSMILITSTPT